MSSGEFSNHGARAAAERNELGRWVTDFLASPGSDNAPLGEALAASHPWWIGPVELPLDRLHRLAGGPGEPVLEVVEEDEWRADVGDLAEKVEDGHEPPPVIVTFRPDRDQLVVEDGNHRLEAIRRAGGDQAWAVVGFGDERDLEHFVARSDHISA
jgi:hypothetical protein